MALVGGVVLVVVVVVVRVVRRWTINVVVEEVSVAGTFGSSHCLFRLMWRGGKVRGYLLVQFP
jgi:hypothetical protein